VPLANEDAELDRAGAFVGGAQSKFATSATPNRLRWGTVTAAIVNGQRAAHLPAVVVASTAGFHVTMDMDFVDPYYAPGVGTPVPSRPTYRESHLAMEKVANSGKMLSFELAEVNPVLDVTNRTPSSASN
jgi:arginase family enzyme